MLTANIIMDSTKLKAALTAAPAPLRQEALESIAQLMVSKSKDNIQARQAPDGTSWPRTSLSDLYASPRIWQDISMSLTFEADGSLGTFSINSTHVAAAVRQFGTIGAGGTMKDIVPIKKKALTIPISQAASRASYNGIDARAAFPKAFILKKDGSQGASPLSLGVIVRHVERGSKKEGTKKGDLEPLYQLVAKVAIRPHPFVPIKDGKIQPENLMGEIETLIVDDLLKRMEEAE